MQQTQMEKAIREILKKARLESAFDKSGEFRDCSTATDIPSHKTADWE